jgi:hypothetical protein
MEIDAHASAVLIAYLESHELWKSLPVGLDKAKAKADRGKAHSAALEVIRLLKFREK